MNRPLSGVTVIDASAYVSGPYATLMLSDLGADVIKIESPKGDPLRHYGYRYPDTAVSASFALINRDKRSVVLDLQAEQGRKELLTLLADADVFLQNWRPGVADRLGLDDVTLTEVNPRLLHVALTGFGPTGPYANVPAFDQVMQAYSGFTHARGTEPPELVPTLLADKLASIFAVQAVLAGLLSRERNSTGDRIDVSMLDACAYFGTPDLLETRLRVAESYDAPPRLAPSLGLVECADGHVVVSPASKKHITEICAAFEHPEWREEIRGMRSFFEIGPALMRMMGRVTGTLTCAEVVQRLRDRDVPVTKALDFDEHLAHPQIVHNETYLEYKDDALGSVRRVRYPATGATWDTPRTSTSSPALDEHRGAVLGDDD